MFILVLLFGIIYVVLNVLQTSFTILGKRGLVAFMHFISVLIWVFIVYQISQSPVINGISFAIGSTLAMYLTHKINLNQVFMKANNV